MSPKKSFRLCLLDSTIKADYQSKSFEDIQRFAEASFHVSKYDMQSRYVIQPWADVCYTDLPSILSRTVQI